MSVSDSQSQVSKTSTAIASINVLKTSDAKVLMPLLSFLNIVAPAMLVKATILVETAQLLSLLINSTKWPWGSILRGIGVPLYFTNLPFWDAAYDVTVDYQGGTGFVWAIVSVLLLTVIAVSYVAYAISEQLTKRGGRFVQLVIHGVAGLLFQPCIHYLLAYAMCTDGGRVADFPAESCWNGGAYQIVVFVAAVVSIILICTCRLARTAFLFDDLPRSRHVRARSVSGVEFAFDGLIFTSMVLYHYLMAVGQRQTFAALVCGGAFLVALGHVVMLPFYHQGMNQFRVVSLLLVSYVALVMTIILQEPASEVSDVRTNWDAVVIFGGGLLVAIAGRALANLRVSTKCLRALDAAARGRYNGLQEGTFPAHLPDDERVRHRDLESVLLGEATFAMSQAHAQGDEALYNLLDERRSLWVGEPFVEAIYFPSDVSVSTRFLNLFAVKTGLLPPSAMLGFAVRIFSKGLARFPRDAVMELDFATVIASFCPGKTQAAMYMLERIVRSERSLPIIYRVYQRGTDIASSMLIRDASHKKVFQLAQKMHKDALQHMVLFWNKLLADSVNIVQLGQLAKVITEKREEGYALFERVVSDGTDMHSMVRFAQFLQQVMMDHEAADVVRENVLDSLEAEQVVANGAGAAGGAHKHDGGGGGAGQPTTALFSSSRSSMSSDRSRTIKNLSRNINSVFGILFLIIVGLFIFGFIHSEQRLKEIDTIHYAGESRTLAQETILLATQLSRAQDTAEAARLHDLLAARLADFREHHANLAKGDYKSSFARVTQLYALPRWAVRYNASHDRLGLLLLGNALVAALEEIVAVEPTEVLTMRQVALDFLQQNALRSAARAFNYSLDVYEEESRALLEVGEYSIIGLFVLSILTILVVYYVLVLNFHRITASKMSTLNLFTLIPKNALEKLHTESAQRLTDFDAPDADFVKMKIARGLEDDTDAMHQVMAEVGADDVEADRGGAATVVATHPTQLQPPSGASRNPGRSGIAGDDDDVLGDSDMADIMPSKFAAMAKNAEVADVGKVKHHISENFEAAYTKDQFQRGPVNAAIDDAKITEEKIDEELRAIQSIVGDNSSATTHSSDLVDGDDAAKKSTEVADWYVYVTYAVLAAIIALTIALLGMLLHADRAAVTSLAQKFAIDDDIAHVTTASQGVADRVRAVENFLSTRDVLHYNDLIAKLRSRDVEDALAELIAALPLDMVPLVHLAEDALTTVEHHQLVATRLVCAANNLTCPDTSETTWTAAQFAAAAYMRVPTIPPAGSDVDLMRPAAEMQQLALEIVDSDLHRATKAAVSSHLDSLMNLLLERGRSDVRDLADSNATLVPVHDALAVMVLAAALVLVYAMLRSQQFASSTMMALVVLVAALAAAILGLAAPRQHNVALEDVSLGMIEFRHQANTTLMLINHPLDLAITAFTHDDPVSPLKLDAFLASSDIDAAFSFLLQNVDPSQFTQLNELAKGIRGLNYVARIITAVACSYWSMYEPPSIRATDWNFTNELQSQRLRLLFPTMRFYTDRAADLALPRHEQMELMRALAFGPFTESLRSSLYDGTAEAVEKHLRLKRDELKDKSNADINQVRAAFVLACVALGIEVFIVIIIMFASVREYEQSNRSASSSSSRQDDALFTRLTRNSQLALGVLSTLFAVIFIITMVDLQGSMSRARDQNAASLREFEMLRTLSAAQRDATGSRYSDAIARGASSVLRASDGLYFGAANPNILANVGNDRSFDILLFGNDSPTTSRFTCRTGASAASTTSSTTNSSVLVALASGVDLALRNWVDEVNWLTRVDDGTASQRLAQLELDTETVLDRMRTTTRDFTQILRRETTNARLAFMIVLAVTLVVLIFQFFNIFRPMIGQLLHEEEGTKVMLKMIPPDVRDSIPAIAEYLETGVVLQDRKMQEINEAASDLSPIPTITIDFKGTILKFSRAAEDAFLWTKEEAVGQNITIIQPENIAVEHDMYLARYRQTGVRKIIGKMRKVRALRRDGSLFPAEITVKEIRVDGVTTFVGALKNISVEMEFERATALSKAVSEAATVPIVVINSRGIIMRFNTAAEETFGCSQDIIGSNVKMLMPAADAELHDQYLETYMKTRIKNIIDTQRRVRAKKASGELFPARVSVRELRRGNDSIFIGYIEDITKHVHLQMASMVSDAIATTSPVPLVSIDELGTIISWSPAAEKVFRLTAIEAMGKNIKIIQPPHVAAKHDAYLKAYANSGRKKMIDTTTVTKARRREADGSFELFSIKISVKDIIQTGKPTHFVAFIQDISSAQQLETEYKIAASIRQLSSSPLITISELGIVQTFSEAAVRAFGYEEDEIVGQNVKKLMPAEIADQHDEILRRYRETGVKNIIGTTRRVHALSKSGKKMPVEIAVHEVKVDGASTFVGYLRDVSAEFRMTEQNAVNDAISQLAVVPMISISRDGTILTCSESTCTKFMWTQEELIGQNIKVLMPDSTASKHDQYLTDYITRLRDLGEEKARAMSRILHKERRTTAKMRDDTLFPVELHVRELLIDGMDPMFVGYVRDITEDLEKATQRHIAEVIIETSTIPLVCIDRLGHIMVFSKAAERAFGWSREEVMGQNVKRLMPDSVAKQHDGYLRAYTKTGIKSVIDSKRQVVAMRKTGEHFNAEITVKENIHQDSYGGETSEYIGFIRDLTQQYILQQANMINEVVAQLSTVPIIVITPRGVMIDFNKAAERDFGYTYDEVFQKNIKMLMPDDVAAQHDGYLQRYRLTGKKTIIDSTRVVTAKRKNGTFFTVEISVKEVKKEGAESQFLGYVRDLTLEKEIAAMYEMNSAIERLSAIPLLVLSERGIVRTFNKAAEEAFGYEAKQVIGKNVKMLMPEEVAVHHDEFLERYLLTGVKSVIDSIRRVQGKRSNGNLVPLELSVREIVLDDGARVYIGYARVVTEEARMAAEMSFNETVNSLSPIPIIAIDHIGTIRRFSHAAEEEFGVKVADVIGTNIRNFMTPEVAAQHDGFLSRYLQTGVKHVVDRVRQVTARRADGSTFPAEITVKEVRDGNNPNAPPSFVGYLRNISNDQRIAEASREGSAMIQLSPIPILVITPRGIVQDVNSAACSQFQYTREELLGQNVKIVMPESVAVNHDSFLKRYMQTGAKTVIDATRRVQGKRRDNTTFEAEISVRELIVEGAERRFIGYIRDCTEELRVQSSLEINDAVSELITTPIVAIDKVGSIIKFSVAAEQLFGYSQVDVIGKNVKMLLPKAVAQFHDGYLSQYQRTGIKSVIDSTRRVQALHSDGHLFNVEIGVREVLNKNGTTLMFIGYIQPLDRAVNVGQSAEVNSTMIDLAAQGIIIIDQVGTIERTNEAARQIFKVPDNIDLVGKNVKMLMPPSIADQHDGYLQRYRATGKKSIIDSTRDVHGRELLSGREIPVEISVREILEKDKPPRYLGYVRSRERDIELEALKRNSDAALNLSPYATIVIDVTGTILMMSRTACTMFDVENPVAVVGKNIKIFMPAEIAAQHDGFLLAYRRTGEKHVIDSLRTVMGKSLRTNEQFEVTLMIKEIKFKDQSIDSVYVGFISKGGRSSVGQVTASSGAGGGR